MRGNEKRGRRGGDGEDVGLTGSFLIAYVQGGMSRIRWDEVGEVGFERGGAVKYQAVKMHLP
jgi:hypothetical protein